MRCGENRHEIREREGGPLNRQSRQRGTSGRIPHALSLRVIAGLVLWLAPTGAIAQEGLRGPPPGPEPVVVDVGLLLVDFVDINADEQTFEFSATLSMRWQDPRLAFDPDEAGTPEKVYQGAYQFAEIFPGWWPQLFLRNESGRFESQGVVLRVSPEGVVSYAEQLQAIAEVKMDLRRLPFDRQRFGVTFELLGFDLDEVRLRPDPERTGYGETTLSQWRIDGVETVSTTDEPVYMNGEETRISAISFYFPATRSPRFLLQLIVFPIMILVALSWSVFWMDRESLGSRMDISFIGILTVVAFQIVVSDRMPRISYTTILSSFMYVSYLTLAASVIVNLRVSALDRRGEMARGNRLDRRCRWLFPTAYVGAIFLSAMYYLIRY